MEPAQTHTKVTRRKFLQLSGAALFLMAGGGLYRAADVGVFSAGAGPAYELWRLDPEREAERSDRDAARLLPYAVLAANAHNTQPWLFRVRPDHMELFADLSRNIGAMDPFYREMYISLGCAVENICLAAHAHGLEPQVRWLEGDWERVKAAEIAFAHREPQASPLFRMIAKRHTHRGAYDPGRPLPDDLLREAIALGHDLPDAKLIWHTDRQERERAGALIVEATEAIVRDEEQARDSHRWYRHRRDDVQRFRDGTTLDATGNPAFIRAMGKLLPISEDSSNAYWLKMTREIHVPTASAFGSIVVSSRSRSHWMDAGRLWQRIHLWAAGQGLAVHPLNQVNERQDRESQLGLDPYFGHALQQLVGEGEHVFMFRIGYARDAALPSPRRPIEEVRLQ